MPASLENYYQQTGRAGRDGKVSHCHLFFNNQDRQRLVKLFKKNVDAQTTNLLDHSQNELNVTKCYEMYRFCESQTDCRRVKLLEHFGESQNKCVGVESCDNCLKAKPFSRDITVEAY